MRKPKIVCSLDMDSLLESINTQYGLDENMSTQSLNSIFKQEKPRKCEQQKEKPHEIVVFSRGVKKQIPSLREHSQVEECSTFSNIGKNDTKNSRLDIQQSQELTT